MVVLLSSFLMQLCVDPVKFPRVMMMVLMIVTNDDDFVLFSVFLYSNENPHIRTYAHQKKATTQL